MSESERSRDAQRKAKSRAAERDITIPPIADPSRRLELEADDRAWLRHYMPDVFFDPFSRDQCRMVEEFGNRFRYGTKKALAASRAGGKTAITRYLATKYMLTGECPFAMYVAESDGKAEQSEKSIKRRLATACRGDRVFTAGTPLGEDYPFECSVAAYVARAPSRANNVTTNGGWRIHVQWAGDQLILPSLEAGDVDERQAWEWWMMRPGKLGSILLACGITGSLLQGANVLDMRPAFVILDDLDKRGSLATEEGKVAGKIEEIIDKTIAGMRGQGRKMGQVMLCTVTARKSVAFRYTDPELKPSWSGERMKRLKSFPSREDLWDKYITLRQKGKGERDEDGRTVDPLGRNAHQFYLDHRCGDCGGQCNRDDCMDRDAIIDNEFLHDTTILPDGTQTQSSSLQWCYDYIADENEESFRTEYQQEPPDEEGVDRLILTAYHVQHNARSGLNQNIVPAETVAVGCGLDIKKLGLHYVVWAFSEAPTRSVCLEYNFHETKFAGNQLRVEDAERAILNALHEWRETRDEHPYLDMDGREFPINLSLIDQGWKDESWISQPAHYFCAEAGLDRFLPCRGWGDGQYHKPTQINRRTIVGDNFHVSFTGQVPHINWNSDHWKLKVQEGFLTKRGDPGSIVLFEPSAVKKGRRQQPHLAYAKHITSEVWEERFVPGYRGKVCKFWKDGAQNHYLDASAQGLVAGALLGATTLTAGGSVPPPPQPAAPVPQVAAVGDDYSRERTW